MNLLTDEEIEACATDDGSDDMAFARAIEAAVNAKWQAMLGEPAQEPVGEVIREGVIRWADKYPPLGAKLYAAPQARQPLTDEQISQIYDDVPRAKLLPFFLRFARAIEKAHGIKGGDV